MKKMDRKEKINFLNKLVKGETSVDELLPETIEVWREVKKDPSTYLNRKTNQELTRPEFDEMKRKRKALVDYIIVTYGNRNQNEK